MSDALRAAAMRSLERRFMAEAQLIVPAAPLLLEHYVSMVRAQLAALGRPMTAEDDACLRGLLSDKLNDAYRAAPQSNIFIRYNIERVPGSAPRFAVASAPSTLVEEYDYWVATRVGSLFGVSPDAKVMDLASALGTGGPRSVLDVGAGTGRNARPLARAGFQTVALELAPALVEVLQDELAKEPLPIGVLCGDVMDGGLAIPHAPFDLCVVAEVIPHLRSVDELARLFRRLSELVRPGGSLLASAFLTKPEYTPDDESRQIAGVLWSSFFTREELAGAAVPESWRLVSDESVLEYEKAHLPAHAWPPTSWYINWASGKDAFDLPQAEAPIELRWLVFQRT